MMAAMSPWPCLLPLVLCWTLAQAQAQGLAAQALPAPPQVESRAQAASGPFGERRDEYQWLRDDDGLPLLAGAAACFVCEKTAAHEAGDHELFIGRVLRLADSHAPPLLFQGGRYRRLGPLL